VGRPSPFAIFAQTELPSPSRRVYTSIKIRYAVPANISTLTLPSFLPHCRPLVQSGTH
jgi:hypothetical protein